LPSQPIQNGHEFVGHNVAVLPDRRNRLVDVGVHFGERTLIPWPAERGPPGEQVVQRTSQAVNIRPNVPSLSRRSTSSWLDPMSDSPGGISTSVMPMEFVVLTGTPKWSAQACWCFFAC